MSLDAFPLLGLSLQTLPLAGLWALGEQGAGQLQVWGPGPGSSALGHTATWISGDSVSPGALGRSAGVGGRREGEEG